MRNHILIKFIAILLATVSLLTVIAGGTGLILFAAADLFEEPPAQRLEKEQRQIAEQFAHNLAMRCASQNLGGCPEEMLRNYNNYYFDHGTYGYTLRDTRGEILDSLPGDGTQYRFVIRQGEYMQLEDTKPAIYADWESVDRVPAENTAVSILEMRTTDGSTHTVFDETVGYIFRKTDGGVHFVPNEAFDFSFLEDTNIASIAFYDGEGELIYSTMLGVGIAEITISQNQMWTFTAAPEAAEETQPENAQTMGYFDFETGQEMVAWYTWQPMPEYIVEVTLQPGATGLDAFYGLMQQVWPYRDSLFEILLVGLLSFALTAVYLCCSAGRRPGSDEIRPGGFNRLPLDLYFCVGGCGVILLIGFGIEVTEYLQRYTPALLPQFLLLAGMSGSLILVAFCYACAAQFKTPGGWWWRNLLGIRCFMLVVHILMGAVRFMEQRMAPWLGNLVIRVWRICVAVIKWSWKLAGGIFSGIFHFLDETLVRYIGKLGRKLRRFYEMLPITWQWLLVGMALFVTVSLSWDFFNPMMQFIGWSISLGIILYGAHSFGILLESARRMRNGDLDTKVSEQFLLGSFRDFARELNGLADVAVVAAQKHLRSERMKTELITNVTHDIKTPLTSIINYVDLLRKPHTPEEEETYLEVLARQSDQMKKLIGDLLEMSKASTGNMAVEIASVHAQEAVAQALGEFSDKLEEANLSAVLRQPEKPLYMKADGRLVWRVLSNLLSNAVKYALPGTRLYVELAEQGDKVQLSLKNISREPLNVSAEELLERFVRGDAARNTEGSGLGLNIARSLMELQKGSLELTVDGDLFKVTLSFPAVREVL